MCRTNGWREHGKGKGLREGQVDIAETGGGAWGNVTWKHGEGMVIPLYVTLGALFQ